MFSKIAMGLLAVFAALVIWASASGWGLAKPLRVAPSVRHGSTGVGGTRRRGYHHYFAGGYRRTHGRYGGK